MNRISLAFSRTCLQYYVHTYIRTACTSRSSTSHSRTCLSHPCMRSYVGIRAASTTIQGVKEVSVPHHVACVNGITGTPQSPDGRVSSVLCDTHRGRYCCFCGVRELKKDSHRGLQSNWGKQCQVTIIVEPVDMRLSICFKCWN